MADHNRSGRRLWGPRTMGVLSGLMLAAGALLPAVAPLQAVALLPILYVLASPKVPWHEALGASFYMGVFYTLPQVVPLAMPPMITAVLLIDLTLVITLFAAGSMLLLRRWPLLGAVGAGALLASLDWLNFTLLPIWGIAQSLARPWSSYPGLIAFISMTGLTGVLFVLACLQAWAVRAAIDPARRIRATGAAAALLAAVVAANVYARSGQTTGTMKVAAIGWTTDDEGRFGNAATSGFKALYEDVVATAAAKGAKLVVSPEMAFRFCRSRRELWLNQFREIARRNNVFLVFGYLDVSAYANRLAVMAPDGQLLATYTKTHLTPSERTRPGTGEVAVTDILGHRVGGMICHDDNYTALTRAHGRREVAMVAVPTLDWRQVKSAHFQSSVNRAIESRYAIVRAARDGISAIVSPHGDVLARRDHFADGPGVVVAEVELSPGRTLFSIAGHWPAMAGTSFVACCFAVMIAQALRARRRRSDDAPA